jgi:diacylglycerol kinase (ATP)
MPESPVVTSPHRAPTGIARLVRAAGHSIDGFIAAYRGESSFRQEVWAAAVLLPLASWVGRDWVETELLIGSALLVLIVELLNSGIESAIDRVSLEWHDLSKRAKDIASAAVLLSLVLCAGVWLAALWHRFVP